MFEIQMQGPAKNALGTEMMTFLLEKLREAAGAPVLLTGTADAFSAGLNLREVEGLDARVMRTFMELLEATMAALYTYTGPTVACVNGHAIAGGCVLTLACDRRVASTNPKIKIGLNEVALGVRFPPRTLAVVTARVPRSHHEEVILGAGLFSPPGALRLGLVDELADDALTVARARLAALSANPKAAYPATKLDLRGTPQTLCADDLHARLLDDTMGLWLDPALKVKIGAILKR